MILRIIKSVVGQKRLNFWRFLILFSIWSDRSSLRFVVSVQHCEPRFVFVNLRNFHFEIKSELLELREHWFAIHWVDL